MSSKLIPQYQEGSILDAVSDVVMTLDQNLQIQWANQKAGDLVNDAPENLMGQYCYQVIPCWQATCEDCPVQMTIKTGATHKREMKASDGRYHKVKSYPLHSQEGVLDGVTVISQSISDRKRTEQALRQSEERSYWAMQATQEGVWDWDLTTNEVYYSPAFAAMLGYTRDEVPPYASFWLEHLHPEDKELAFRANKECIENRRKNFEIEFRMLTKNGVVRWILGRGMAVSRDDQGRATRLVCTYADITRRKQMEEELRQSENYYRAIFEASGSAMHVVEEDTTISQVNSSAAALSGYAKQEIEGIKSWTEFVHPEDLEWMKKYHYARRRDPSTAPRSYEFRFLDRNGGVRHGYQTVALIPGSTQSVVSLVDITDRKEAETRLQAAHDKLDTLVKLNAEGLMVLDRAGVIRFLNPAAVELLSRKQDELLGEYFGYPLIPGSNTEIELLSDSGEPKVVELRARDIQWSGQLAILTSLQDVTERKRAEEELREKGEELEAIYDNAPLIMLLLDSEWRVRKANTYSTDFIGVSEESMKGQRWGDVLRCIHHLEHPSGCGFGPSCEHCIVSNSVLETVRTGRSLNQVEANLTLIRGGSEREMTFLVSNTLLQHKSQPMVLLAMIDITERKAIEKKLRQISFNDSLTGLYNRNFFEEEMNRLSDRRYSPLGIIIFDVDGLKFINDTLGHEIGDNTLITLAGILKENFRASDILARIGGDEFAVLLPQVDQVSMQGIVKRVRSSVDRFNRSHSQIPLSVSIGQALSQYDDAPDMAALFREADNRMYREKMQREQSARNSTVQGLIQAMEARDFITEGHSDRLQELVSSLAREMDMAQQEINDLMLLARFHDLGKVGIPDRILFKPGLLSDEEYQEMKRHSEIGERIARSVPDLLPIADWIRKHHEKWDGTGYPQGLRGEDIPLSCRILTIADAYDAMTNERPYREAMTREDATAELKRCSGTQFDPDLVERFIRLLQELDKE